MRNFNAIRRPGVLAGLVIIIALFQSCGSPRIVSYAQNSGNGTGYETPVPIGNNPVELTYAFGGTCADATANQAEIRVRGSAIFLVRSECRVVEPARLIPIDQITVGEKLITYEGLTFTLSVAP